MKALTPNAFMPLFMDRVSGFRPDTGFAFEKLEVLGSIPEGELRHVLTRIQIGLWPVTMKKMEAVSLRREGEEWKLMLTKEFEGLLARIQTPPAE